MSFTINSCVLFRLFIRSFIFFRLFIRSFIFSVRRRQAEKYYIKTAEFCYKLSEVNAAGVIESVGSGAFYACSSLRSFDFMSGMEKLRRNSFVNTGLTSANIPASVTTIEDYSIGYNYSNSQFTAVDGFTITGLPGSAAETYAKNNGFTFNSVISYTANSDGTIKITKYTGNDANLTIPAKIDGKTVKSIDKYAFNGNKTIKELTLPAGMEQVDSYAFYGCINLETVNLPASVGKICDYAFEFCSKLTAVNAEGVIKRIETGAFYACNSLESFTLKNGAEYIAQNAFVNTALTSINIPSSVTTIEDYSIGYNYSSGTFTAVRGFTINGFPDSAAETYANNNGFIFNSVFEYTTNDDGTVIITKYTGSDETLVIPATIGGKKVSEIALYAFNRNNTIKELTLPEGMKKVDSYAFYGCEALETVNLPASVERIGTYAFEFCSKLTTVNAEGVIKKIEGGAFYACNSLESFTLKNGAEYIAQNAFVNTALTSITIPSSVTTIEDNSLGYNYSGGTFTPVRGFTINGSPDSAAETYANNNGFIFNSVLTYTTNDDGTVTITGYTGNDELLIIPEKIDGKPVSSIAGYAFFRNETIKELILPEGMESVDPYAFYGCYALESVILPVSVKSIGEYAFQFCGSLTNISTDGALESIGEGAFYGCESLEGFEISEGTTSIGQFAFTNTSLTSAFIPCSVTTIGDHAFGYDYFGGVYTKTPDFTITCDPGSAAESYAVENGFQTISTFSYDENNDGTLTLAGYSGSMSDIVIPASVDGKAVTKIGNYAFSYNDSIKSVKIPDSVTFIGVQAFYYCTGLETVDFGKGVEIIDNQAFLGCGKLSSVVIPDSTTAIGDSAFYDCSSLSSVTLGSGLKQIAGRVFQNTPELKSIELPSGIESIGDYAVGAYYEYDGNVTSVDYYMDDFTVYAEHDTVGHKYAVDNGLKYVDTNPVVNVTKVTLDKTALTINVGGTAVLKATVTPDNATDKTITWLTSDKTVATVKNGTITALKAGTCTIYAKSSNGKKASCTVTVSDVSPLNNTSVINSTVVQVGDKVRVSASANGGTAPYTYAYYYKRSTNNTWKVLGTEWGTNTSVSFTPAAEADYDVKVIVKDKNGVTAEKTFTVSAIKELELTNVSVLQRTNVKLGTAIPMIGKAVGGAGDYTYSFYFKRSTNTNWKLLGTKFSEVTTARLKPTASGEYDIRIDVKDSKGTIAKKFFTATVK